MNDVDEDNYELPSDNNIMMGLQRIELHSFCNDTSQAYM